MRLLAVSTFALALSATGALAQSTGADVVVNPGAAGTQVLLYPGGQYTRVVPPLLEPGEAPPGEPIHLHPPHARRPVTLHVATRPARPKKKRTETASAPPRPAPEPAPQPAAQPAPPMLPPDSGAASLTFNDQNAPPPQPAHKPAPKPVRKAEARPPVHAEPVHEAPAHAEAPPPKPEPAAARPEPARTASVAPTRHSAPAENPSEGLTLKSAILFAQGASDPAPSALGDVKKFADGLGSALLSGSARVQLIAYGGPRGDKSSDSRRLSLKRALIIRQLLIDDGIPSERIDVRAMGGTEDGGPPDRVDIFLQG